jgi:uracil-DNA glycosylase
VAQADARRRSGRATLDALAAEAAGCRACDLWTRGTQTVFGDGPANARLVLVGEQPGDEEDEVGEPFVGPAGRLLDRALAEARVDRRKVYVTNAVKHFKWELRGKRRIHQRPNRTEIVACHRWLEGELGALDLRAVLVTLGAVAGESLFGASYRVGKARGTLLELDGRRVVPTIHPSALLRARRGPEWDALYGGFVEDLARARELAA